MSAVSKNGICLGSESCFVRQIGSGSLHLLKMSKKLCLCIQDSLRVIVVSYSAHMQDSGRHNILSRVFFETF